MLYLSKDKYISAWSNPNSHLYPTCKSLMSRFFIIKLQVSFPFIFASTGSYLDIFVEWPLVETLSRTSSLRIFDHVQKLKYCSFAAFDWQCRIALSPIISGSVEGVICTPKKNNIWIAKKKANDYDKRQSSYVFVNKIVLYSQCTLSLLQM